MIFQLILSRHINNAYIFLMILLQNIIIVQNINTMSIFGNKIQQIANQFNQLYCNQPLHFNIIQTVFHELQEYSQLFDRIDMESEQDYQLFKKQMMKYYQDLKQIVCATQNSRGLEYLKKFNGIFAESQFQRLKYIGNNFIKQTQLIQLKNSAEISVPEELKNFCKKSFVLQQKRLAQSEIEQYFKTNFTKAEKYYLEHKIKESHRDWLQQPIIYTLLKSHKQHPDLKRLINIFISIEGDKVKNEDVLYLKQIEPLFQQFNKYFKLLKQNPQLFDKPQRTKKNKNKLKAGNKPASSQSQDQQQYEVIIKFINDDYCLNLQGTTKIKDLIKIIEEKTNSQLEDLIINSPDIDLKKIKKTIQYCMQNKKKTEIIISKKEIIKVIYHAHSLTAQKNLDDIKTAVKDKFQIQEIQLAIYSKSGKEFNNHQQINEVFVQDKINQQSLKKLLQLIQFNKERKLKHTDIIKIQKEPSIKDANLSFFDWMYKVEAHNIRSNCEIINFLNRQDIEGLDYKTFLILIMESYFEYREEIFFDCVKFGIALPYIYQFIQKSSVIYKCKLDPFEPLRLKNEFHLISIGSHCYMGKSKLLNKLFGTEFKLGRKGAIFGGIDVVTHYKQNLDTIRCNIFDVHQSYYFQRENLKFLRDSINSKKTIFLIQVFNKEDAEYIKEDLLKAQWKPLKIIFIYRDIKKDTKLPASTNDDEVCSIPVMDENNNDEKGIGILKTKLFGGEDKNDIGIFSKIIKKYENQQTEEESLAVFYYTENIKLSIQNKHVQCSFESNILLQDLNKIVGCLRSPQTFTFDFADIYQHYLLHNKFAHVKKISNMLQTYDEENSQILNYLNITKDKLHPYLEYGNRIQILKPDHKLNTDYRALFDKLEDLISIVSIIGGQSTGKSTLLNLLFGTNGKVNSGGCTKGVYFSIFPTNYQNTKIGILDTQGILSGTSGNKNLKQFDKMIIILSFIMSNVVIINIKGQLSSEIKQLILISLFGLTRLFPNRKHKPKLIFVLRDMSDLDIKYQIDSIDKLTKDLKEMARLCNAQLNTLVEYDAQKSFVLLESAIVEKKVSQKFVKNIQKNLKPKIFETKKQQGTYGDWFQNFINAWNDIQQFKQFYMVKQLIELNQQKTIQFVTSCLIKNYLDESTPIEQTIISIQLLFKKPIGNKKLDIELEEYMKGLEEHQEPYKSYQITQSMKDIKEKYKQQVEKALQMLNLSINENKQTCQSYSLSPIMGLIKSRLKEYIQKIINSNELQLKILNEDKEEEKTKKTIGQKINSIKEDIINLAKKENYQQKNINSYLQKFDKKIENQEFHRIDKNQQLKFSNTRELFKLPIYILSKQEVYYTTQSINQSEAHIPKINQQLQKQNFNFDKLHQIISKHFKLTSDHQIFTSKEIDVADIDSINSQLIHIQYEFLQSLKRNSRAYKIVLNFLRDQLKSLKTSKQSYKDCKRFGEYLVKPLIITYHFFLHLKVLNKKIEYNVVVEKQTKRQREQLYQILTKKARDVTEGKKLAYKLLDYAIKYIKSKVEQNFKQNIKKITIIDPKNLSDICEKYYFNQNDSLQQIIEYLQTPQKKIRERFNDLFEKQYGSLFKHFNFNKSGSEIILVIKQQINLTSNLISIFKDDKTNQKFNQQLLKKNNKKSEQNIQKLNLEFLREYFKQYKPLEHSALAKINTALQLKLDLYDNREFFKVSEKKEVSYNLSKILDDGNINISNPYIFFMSLNSVFEPEINKILSSDEILKTYIPSIIHPDIQEIVKNNFDISKGCMKQCPYCNAKCNKKQKVHEFHETQKHRFGAFNGITQLKYRQQKQYKSFEFIVCNTEQNIKHQKYSSRQSKQVYPTIRKQRAELGAEEGEVTITLKWRQDIDLDLYIECPCVPKAIQKNQGVENKSQDNVGRKTISYMNKTCKLCGQTQLDLDMQGFVNIPQRKKLKKKQENSRIQSQTNEQPYLLENIFLNRNKNQKDTQFKNQYPKNANIKCWVNLFKTKEGGDPIEFQIFVTYKNYEDKTQPPIKKFVERKSGTKCIIEGISLEPDFSKYQEKQIQFLKHNETFYKKENWKFEINYNKYDFQRIKNGWKKIAKQWERKWVAEVQLQQYKGV